jgi:long-chain acyl-CoA synthetase
MEPIWINRYDEGVPHSLDYPDWTLPDLLHRSARRFPHSPAVWFYGRPITFLELEALTTKFALVLQSLGVSPGDRVTLMLPNLPQTLICYYGALKAGAVVVQTNPLYVTSEIEQQLWDTGSETMVALDLFYPRIQSSLDHTPLKRIILTRVSDFLSPLRRLLYPIQARMRDRWVHIPRRSPIHELSTLLHRVPMLSKGKMDRLPSLHPDDIALLQYTGGTTGTPKGVMLSHRNMIVNAIQCQAWVPDFQEGREVFLGVIPFFHAYGLSTTQHIAIMTGASQILLPRFQVQEVLEAIHRHRVTIFSGIPAMFMMMNECEKVSRYDLRSLRVCLSGASPLPTEVQERFRRLTGVKISEGYGMTEASPVTHCNPVYGDTPAGSIGLPFPDTHCRIVDLETGTRDLAIGEAGELLVRGPQVMRGYWRNNHETQAVLKDGWLHTGDIVRRNPVGFFFLVDRKKDMIKSRGENVYPREVEEVLLRHEAIKDTVIVGIPHQKFGEAVKAYIVLKEGRSVTQEALLSYCRNYLAVFKVPTAVEFRNELPRNIVGKVLRRQLREEEVAKVSPETLSPARVKEEVRIGS